MKKFDSIKDELLYITKKNGGVCSPHKVVEFATNPETNLHSKFTWDDTKAAYEYRLVQARRIISLEFVVIENDKTGEKFIIREFQSLPPDRHVDGGYRLVTDVMKDNDMQKQLVDQALMELMRIKSKYEKLTALAGVFRAVDKLKNKVEEDKRPKNYKEAEFQIEGKTPLVIQRFANLRKH